jgi:uncharacterized protein YdhG (YjbR/CyaY superfamily)
MATNHSTPTTIDEYIPASSPEVQAILQKIRKIVRSVAPDVEETISYKIPAFKLHGVLVYFAAFKSHIGFYPPIKGDEQLEKAVAPYANEKGSLRFPLAEPIPYDLIKRLTQFRVKQNLAKAAAKAK